MPKCVNAHDLCYGGAGGPCEYCELSDEEAFEKDYSRKCEVCGDVPVVRATGLCGPCTFGEADTAGGNW